MRKRLQKVFFNPQIKSNRTKTKEENRGKTFMTDWTKRLAISLVIPGLLILGGCGGTAAGNSGGMGSSQQASTDSSQPKTMKVGVVLQESHSTGKGIKKFAELVEQKSGGNIKVTPYYAGQLGDEQKMKEAIQAGIQEAGVISPSIIESDLKEFGIFSLPFAFNNEQEAKEIIDGPFGQKLFDMLPQQDIVGLSYFGIGMRDMVNSKHPITTLEDFQGMKIRSMQVQIHLEAYKALGINPQPMPYTEVFTAMETKAIDGAENTLTVIESDKYNEVSKYLSLTDHLYSTMALMVSKKFWDQLSPEEQKILKEAALEARDYQDQEHIVDVKSALEKLQAAGMEINEFSPEERKRLQEVVKPVIDQFAKEIGEDLVNELYAELEKVRK